VHGRYLVEDPAGQLLGSFKKEFAKSLLNSTWTIFDQAGQPRIVVSESNQVLAIVRRFGGLIPFIGTIIELMLPFFKYHFVLTDLQTAQPVGRYQKTTLIRDHYTLHMTDEAYSAQDWRVLAAMAVGLDALQSR
jgi:hypothetical protein